MATTVETKMEKLKASFTSTFVGFSGFPQDVGVYTPSPIVELDGKFWCVRIYPGGYDEESRNYLSCFLCHSGEDLVRASYKISVVNQKGWKNHEFISPVKAFTRDKPFWGESRFLLKNDLTSSKNGFCVEDKLVIKVEMDIFGNIEHRVKSTSSYAISSPKKVSSLTQELSSILFTDSLTDVTLVVEDVRIPAHKFMLCLRSEVFRAMLTARMSESCSNEIIVKDFDVTTVKELLHFIYTDECTPKSLESNCEMLLAASSKYQIKDLESLCEVHMSTTINVNNVVNVLYLADLYQKKQLKLCALQFIAHNAKAVIQTENFFENLGFSLCQEVMKVLVGIDIADKQDP